MLSLRDELKKAIEQLKPHFHREGGDIELVDFEDGIVKVRLKGACAGCPMSQTTFQWGVEQFLKKKLPYVERVEAVK